MIGSGLAKCTEDEENPLTDYSSCLHVISCKEKSIDYFFNECSDCNSLFNSFSNYLETIFENSMIDDISYKRWLSTDRTTLETISKPVNEFIEDFCQNLKVLKRHDYIAKQQSAFCSEKKNSLCEGEVMILADFAENYCFLLQDAAQGFHWNNSQATLHPFVCYFKGNDELKHLNFVVVSDCLHHDTVAVHLFLKKVIEI